MRHLLLLLPALQGLLLPVVVVPGRHAGCRQQESAAEAQGFCAALCAGDLELATTANQLPYDHCLQAVLAQTPCNKP